MALALLGLALAPILNGLADNLPRNDPTGANAIRRTTYVPRCAYCGEPQEGLAAHALLARFAGRPGCVHCGAPASRRAEWIAVALALLFSLLWVEGRHDALSLLGGAVAVFLFLLVTVLDLERRLVLLEVVVGGGLLLVIVSALEGHLVASLVGLLIGAAVFFILFSFGIAFARATGSGSAAALGLGDVSLAALVGLAVGWPAVLPTLLIAILLAGAAGGAILVWNLARHRPTGGITMAYGPYLAIAALATLVFGTTFIPRGIAPH